MTTFDFQTAPMRVIFGFGRTKELPGEIQRLNARVPLILSTPEQTDKASCLQRICRDSGIEAVEVYSNATMHTPLHITNDAISFLKSSLPAADCIISIGGGSTIGLGKAICLRTALPHICIPTTYAGSEMTPILGETSDGAKTTINDGRVLPQTVIYDVEHTLTLPVALSATSGVNAMAHAVEAMYARNRNPIIEMMAFEGIKSLAEALPDIIQNHQSISAREKAQYGAWLCGICLGSSEMSLHHKLCHVLGGSFNLPHAETHAIVLPHALSYNAPAVSTVLAKLANAFPVGGTGQDAIAKLNSYLDKLRVHRALRDFGMKESDIEEVATRTISKQYPNPRPMDMGAIRELIRRCWAGESARADL